MSDLTLDGGSVTAVGELPALVTAVEDDEVDGSFVTGALSVMTSISCVLKIWLSASAAMERPAATEPRAPRGAELQLFGLRSGGASGSTELLNVRSLSS